MADAFKNGSGPKTTHEQICRRPGIQDNKSALREPFSETHRGRPAARGADEGQASRLPHKQKGNPSPRAPAALTS
jgi:hypothetical protein